MVLLAFRHVSLASDHAQLNKYKCYCFSSCKHKYIHQRYTLQCTVSCNMILSHDLCLPIAAFHCVLLANVCTTARCISAVCFSFQRSRRGRCCRYPSRKRKPRSSGLRGAPNASCDRRDMVRTKDARNDEVSPHDSGPQLRS